MIFLYIVAVVFALLVAFDWLMELTRNASTRERSQGSLGGTSAAADDPPVSGNLHAVINSVGDEAGRVEFAFPQSNVRPIHHRRSMAQPYLKVVAVDQATRDLLEQLNQNETPAA